MEEARTQRREVCHSMDHLNMLMHERRQGIGVSRAPQFAERVVMFEDFVAHVEQFLSHRNGCVDVQDITSFHTNDLFGRDTSRYQPSADDTLVHSTWGDEIGQFLASEVLGVARVLGIGSLPEQALERGGMMNSESRRRRMEGHVPRVRRGFLVARRWSGGEGLRERAHLLWISRGGVRHHERRSRPTRPTGPGECSLPCGPSEKEMCPNSFLIGYLSWMIFGG